MSRRMLMMGLSGVIVLIVVCSIVYLYYSNTTSAHTHNLKHFVAVMPTCTTDGHFEYWWCDDCGKLFWDKHGTHLVNDSKDLVWKAQHNLQHNKAISPTCSSTGFKEHWYCIECDTYYLDSKASIATTYDELLLPIVAHTLEYKPYHSSSCTEHGNIEHWQCTMCNECYLDKDATRLIDYMDTLLPLAPHSLHTHEAVEPTCISTGNIEYEECTHCHSYFVNGEETSYENIILPTTPHIDSGYYQFDDKTHCKLCSFCNQSFDCHTHDFHDEHCIYCGYVLGSSDKLLYSLTTNGYYVVGVIGNVKDIAVPYSYNGKRVLGIAQNAFSNSQINSVIISKGVVHIEQYAFANCNRLHSILLPDSTVSIGANAFQYCTSLQSIQIPSSVVVIGDKAYLGCNAVTSIKVDENKYYNSYNGCLIDTISKRVIFGTNTATLPTDGSATIIGECAFYNSAIANISLPDTIVAIEDYAFYGSLLQAIVVPDSVKTIGAYAFAGCTYLLSAIIGNGTTTIMKSAFADNMQLTTVVLGCQIQLIENFAFYNTAISIIYYYGTVNQWQRIIFLYKAIPAGVNIYYHSQEPPTMEGNFWHWNNGAIVEW